MGATIRDISIKVIATQEKVKEREYHCIIQTATENLRRLVMIPHCLEWRQLLIDLERWIT